MAKAPVPGTMKTRLLLPPRNAAELQTAFVRDTVEKARSLGFGSVTVAGAPPEGLSLLGALLPDEGVIRNPGEGFDTSAVRESGGASLQESGKKGYEFRPPLASR